MSSNNIEKSKGYKQSKGKNNAKQKFGAIKNIGMGKKKQKHSVHRLEMATQHMRVKTQT